MRIAVAATSLAAIVALPLAMAAIGPRQSEDNFLNQVACVAYENARGGDVAAAKVRLNWESHRQSAETVAQARERARAAEQRAASAGGSAPACDPSFAGDAASGA